MSVGNCKFDGICADESYVTLNKKKAFTELSIATSVWPDSGYPVAVGRFSNYCRPMVSAYTLKQKRHTQYYHGDMLDHPHKGTSNFHALKLKKIYIFVLFKVFTVHSRTLVSSDFSR